MEPITIIALGTAAMFILGRGKKKTGAKPKPTTTPKPGILRLSAALSNGKIVFAPSTDTRVKIEDNEAFIEAAKLPIDFLVSVPEPFAPLQLAEDPKGARLLAGTPGTTMDLQFRGTAVQMRTPGATSVRLTAEVENSQGIFTGPLWVTLLAPASKAGVQTMLYMGNQGVWHFVGRIDGVIVIEDGPFATEEAAATAASNWAAAQAK